MKEQQQRCSRDQQETEAVASRRYREAATERARQAAPQCERDEAPQVDEVLLVVLVSQIVQQAAPVDPQQQGCCDECCEHPGLAPGRNGYRLAPAHGAVGEATTGDQEQQAGLRSAAAGW